MPAPATVWETVRHLRFRQIRYQLARRLVRTRMPDPIPMRWSPSAPGPGVLPDPARRRFLGGDRFRFNNEERGFSGDWNDPSARKLWLYNLHYMAWLSDLDGGHEEWIARWIRENPPSAGGAGWEPYPLSLRLFHWCRHYSRAGAVPDGEVMASMGLQSSWLLDNLEFHIDGNHLLENLLSLAMAGFHMHPGSPRAAAARAKIGRLLREELAAQFLDDGGHYELSPMYHSILLERILDLLDCWPQGEDPYPGLRPALASVAVKALGWLEVMSVGGRFSLFNDAAYDAAPDAIALRDYGRRLLACRPAAPAALRALEASGYYRAETGRLTVIFDGGGLGPDHQMGHAQGDMLSFCLWLDGDPVLVHPGNYEYLPGPMRDYCRSTASHNTLVPEGHEQAEWWASHRVGRRGRVRGSAGRIDAATGAVLLQGSHDGFRRLRGGPIHRREMSITADTVTIQDILAPDPGCSSRAYFHFHPDCVLERESGGIRIRLGERSLRMGSDSPLDVEDSWYCPEFGLRLANRAVVARLSGRSCRTWLRIAD